MGARPLHQDFEDAAYLHSSRVANDCDMMLRDGLPGMSILADLWSYRSAEYAGYVYHARPRLEEMADYFGRKTVGRCLELIDFEHTILSKMDWPLEHFDNFSEILDGLQNYHDHYVQIAAFCMNDAGLSSAHLVKTVTEDLERKVRLWRRSLITLVNSATDLRLWQQDVLSQDADTPFGAYETPIEETPMQKVMDQREEHLKNISRHYEDSQFFAEDVFRFLERLTPSYESLHHHAKATIASILKSGYSPA